MFGNKKVVFENKAENEKSVINTVFDWYDIIVSAVVVIVLLFTFCFTVVGVDGSSMETTLHGGEKDNMTDHADRLIISNLFYTPKQGDIVVISRNYGNAFGEEAKMSQEPIIKRVIATEGQTVDIDFENNKVYVNGEVLDEPYVCSPTVEYDNGVTFPLTVEEGHVFVLGDNRAVSLDSRSSSIGQVDVRYILGKAMLRIMPIEEFGGIY